MTNTKPKEKQKSIIDNDNPFEILFINEEGKIEIFTKKQLGKPIPTSDGNIYLNNHYDVLNFFIQEKNLTNEEEANKLKEKNSFIDYAKLLLENNYIIINNITYYGIIEKEELDILMAMSENITQNQLNTIEEIKDIFDNKKTRTILASFDLKNNYQSETYIQNYEELKELIIERKTGRIKW